jgi:hypothetical protein
MHIAIAKKRIRCNRLREVADQESDKRAAAIDAVTECPRASPLSRAFPLSPALSLAHARSHAQSEKAVCARGGWAGGHERTRIKKRCINARTSTARPQRLVTRLFSRAT